MIIFSYYHAFMELHIIISARISGGCIRWWLSLQVFGFGLLWHALKEMTLAPMGTRGQVINKMPFRHF